MTPEQTNMMAYLLAGMGEGLSAEGSPGQIGGGMAKQWAQSAQYMNLLKQMLGGMPAGSKMSGDRDNLNFKIPTGSLSMDESPELGGPSKPAGGYGMGGVEGEGITKSQGVINPFSSSLPEVSGAALAGLTTGDISQALQFKFTKEQLGQKKMSDVADMLYKQGMLGVAERGAVTAERKADTALIGQAIKLREAFRKYPVEVPGIGLVDFDTWEKLDPDAKKYAAYVAMSKAQKPDEPTMDRDEWDKDVAAETKVAYLKALQEDPSLLETAKALRPEPIRISIGERESIEKMKDRVGRESKILSPTFHQDVIKDLMKDDTKWRASTAYEGMMKKYGISRGQAREEVQKQMVLEDMNRRIMTAFGEDVKFDYNVGWTLDGKVLVRNPYVE